jgi:hypothetical protein
MRQSKEVLTVACVLSEQELLRYGMQLAAERPKEEQLDNELKEFADQVKAHKSKIKAVIADLSNRINQKKEYRSVECMIRYDFTRGDKIWIRTDTNEIVKREPIPGPEMQEEATLDTPQEGDAA